MSTILPFPAPIRTKLCQCDDCRHNRERYPDYASIEEDIMQALQQKGNVKFPLRPPLPPFTEL